MNVNDVSHSQIASWTAKEKEKDVEDIILESDPILDPQDDDCTGYWTSEDNNHFIGLDFIGAYQKVDQKKNKMDAPRRAKPTCFFC